MGRLEYAARRQQFAVVTGDCGTGKTTTIRKFKDTLDASRFIVVYLADSKLTPRHGRTLSVGSNTMILPAREVCRRL